MFPKEKRDVLNEELHVRTRILTTIFLVISLLFLLLFPQHKMQAWKDFFVYFLSPAPSFTLKIFKSTENLGKNFWGMIRANEENKRLVNQLYDYIHKQNELEEIVRENGRFRQLLGYSERSQVGLIPAQVITRDPQTWYHSIIIDKGTKDGIRLDSPVIAIEGEREGVVGRVVEITASASKILLLTDTISALVGYSPQSNYDGIVEGKNSHELVFKYLNPDAELKAGEVVLTAGLGGIFPAGIPVGIVSRIEKTKQEPFKTVYLKPYLNLSHIRDVLVINISNEKIKTIQSEFDRPVQK